MKKNLLTKTFELTTSNVDANNVATSKFLLQAFQDVATLHADHLGFGWDALNADKKLWVVSKIAVEVLRPVMLGDSVVVSTWPVAPNKFFADRHYQMCLTDGTVLVNAVSRWCVIDFDTRKMANPMLESQKYYDGEYLEKVSGATFEVKKVVLDDSFELSYTKQVRWTDLDLNHHVNNTNYVDIAVDSLSSNYLLGKYASAFELTYHGECRFGDQVHVYSKLVDGEHKVVGQKNGATCFTYTANYKNLQQLL